MFSVPFEQRASILFKKLFQSFSKFSTESYDTLDVVEFDKKKLILTFKLRISFLFFTISSFPLKAALS